MAKCNDCWCEYYDKNKGKCDECMKNESEKNKPELNVILKKRAVKQMELDNKNKSNRQQR